MIVLDTNVVSEAMKPEPHSCRALLAERAETPYLSSVTLAVLQFGIGRCRAGGERRP